MQPTLHTVRTNGPEAGQSGTGMRVVGPVADTHWRGFQAMGVGDRGAHLCGARWVDTSIR